MSKPRETVRPPTSWGDPTYTFAHPTAEKLWEDGGRPVLSGEPSGKTGYTADDVRAALED